MARIVNLTLVLYRVGKNRIYSHSPTGFPKKMLHLTSLTKPNAETYFAKLAGVLSIRITSFL